jgi:hypothetical protein
MCAPQSFSTPRHAERSRPRLQAGDDAGGYRAYGYGPLIPSDLKGLHSASVTEGAQHDHA